jgi:hypothetical protein
VLVGLDVRRTCAVAEVPLADSILKRDTE